MGIIHKLRPEVINFILENKKNDPSLSCRTLTQLILEKLQVKVSKSSINDIFKENNLSMPIGRRQKEKKKKFNMPVLPPIEEIKAVVVVKESSKSIQEQVVNSSLRGAEGDEANTKSKIASGTSCPRNDEEKKEEINPEEKRIKEAEEWAKKLQEEERLKAEERLKTEKQKTEGEDAKKKEEEAELKFLLQEASRIKTKEDARLRKEEEEIAAAEEKRLEEEIRLRKAEEETVAAEEKRLEEEIRLRKAEAAEEEARLRKAEEEKRLEEEAHLRKAEEAHLRKAEEETAAVEEKRLEAEAKKIEEEQAVQEAELRAEREKWAKLAELEHTVKEQREKEETAEQKEEPAVVTLLPQNREGSAAILLKALDCLIGGSKEINEAICKGLGVLPESSLNLTETLIFRYFFGKDELSALLDLIGAHYPSEKVENYYAQIQQDKNIKLDIIKAILSVFTEVRGVKMHFIDGSIVYLDGQLHSAWSTANLPYDFSSPIYELKNNLNKYFFQDSPFVLFSASGYDIVSKDFFNLLLNTGSADKYPDNLTLFGNNSEEIENISLNNKNNCSLVFGIWPWQFVSSRKVKKIGEFNLKHVDAIEKDLYLAQIEIELMWASLKQSITLKGCAIKTDPKEKIRLVIINSPDQGMPLDKLAGIYLSRWPNFEEAFHDFSRKIELFAYVGNVQKFFPRDSFGMDAVGTPLELEAIFTNYIKMLDAYLRWHFLPSGYIENDLSVTRQHFYKLPVKFTASKGIVKAAIQPGQGYQFLKELEYLMRRLNERQIILANGSQIYFETAFK